MPAMVISYLVVEIVAFCLLGWWVGFGWAFLILMLLLLAGMIVSAWQFRALAHRVANHPTAPGRLTADAALTVVGAFLVALPGLVSTATGLLLMLPPTRALIRRALGAGARNALTRFGGTTFTTVTHYGAPGASQTPGWGEVIDHREGEGAASPEAPPRRDEPGDDFPQRGLPR